VADAAVRRVSLRSWIALVAAVVAILAGITGAGTTTASAAVLTYDVPIIARVDVHHVDTAAVTSAQLSDLRAWSASSSGQAQGRSTTPPARSVATNTVRPIGFAPGEGVSALTPGRLQHGTRHLTDAGVLPAWSGTNSPQLIRNTLSPILENPTATFNNALGGTQVKGFIGTVNGQTVAVQVYAEGPLAGQLATAVVPTANQLTKWGVGP
jgi:hypothetical protein